MQKGNAPVTYITAHLSKIHGLDWSRSSGTVLATCSNDATVKVMQLVVTGIDATVKIMQLIITSDDATLEEMQLLITTVAWMLMSR